MKTTKFEIEGMTCGHCVAAVRKSLESHDGVHAARVQLESGSAEVEYDESTVGPEQLIAAVVEEGYAARIDGQAS